MNYLLYALLYFLVGSVYSLTYVLIFKPEGHQVSQGLQILFWPVFLVIELVLGLASQFGKVTSVLSKRVGS